MTHYCYSCGAPLEERIIDGIKREACTVCDYIHYKNPLPVAAAVVINEKDELLLVFRDVEPRKGYWCLPCGYIETGESTGEAALRELEEETGIKGNIISHISNVSIANAAGDGWVIITAYHIKQTGGVLSPGDDAADVHYFPLDALPELAFRAHYIILEKVLSRSVK